MQRAGSKSKSMRFPLKIWLNFSIAISIALAVLGFRLHMVHEHGLQFPINDQWYSEYDTLYKPFSEGSLKFSDLFSPNNEHVVAIQKGIHLALVIAIGEWNPMAQMFLNAVFFSTLMFIAAFFAGLYLGQLPSVILQITIFACGLMPGPAENFLFGFQTGWYVYYFISGLMLLCLSKSKKFDLWWMAAWLFAILSCLCLAAGIGNLLLCLLAPSLRNWTQRVPINKLFVRSTPYLLLCLPSILFFFRIAIAGRPELPQTEHSFILNLIEIFSYPTGFFPITYLPALFGLILVICRHPIVKEALIGFPFLFATWASLHAGMLSVGRGGFSGRHTELLLFGILANLLLLLLLAPFFMKSSRSWAPRFPAVWIAVIFGGLAYQAVQSRGAPREFADFMLPRYDLIKESVVLKNQDVLSSRSRNTGLPAGLFAARPGLWSEPTVQKIAPSFFPPGMCLTPAPDPDLLLESTQMFPTAFPFLPWIAIRGAGNGEKFSVDRLSQPYAKIVFAGRWDDPATGIYADGQKLGIKLPFSQLEGWRAVFLPTKDGSMEFTAKVAGERDWLLLQQPIPVSRLQVAMEFVGRQAWRIWAVFMGLSIFLMVLNGFLAGPLSGTPKEKI